MSKNEGRDVCKKEIKDTIETLADLVIDTLFKR